MSKLMMMVSAVTALWAVNELYKLKHFLHMMQLESYQNDRYISWMREYKDKVYTKKSKVYLINSIILTVLYLLVPITMKEKSYYIILLIWGIVTLLTIEYKKYESKKPLVFTKRAKRLYTFSVCALIFDMIISFLLVKLVSKNLVFYYPVVIGILGIINYYSAYYLVIGNHLVRPIEKSINNKFYNMAYKKVREMENLLVVGITGSYGKTSTKFITAKILEEKYITLKTPESYNTPMGISKVINNSLQKEHEVFVSELGAERVGEIKEVALLTNPKIGIITSIGPCHLQTFGSIDNIMRTKYELIDELPNDGIAIFNYDNVHVKKLADKTFKEKILYGIDDIEVVDIFATDIEVNELGSTFTLCDKERGTINCKTKLLGRHNILNILAGAAVGKAAGLSLFEIAKGIEKIEPVEHRLQLINPGTGTLVIDDAFNSNPDGAKAALDVIDKFKGGKKIIVTPGMVELGKKEIEENEKFGENIAKTCDYAILVGKKRTEPIYKGMMNMNFDASKIIIVNSLDEVNDHLRNIVKPKDVVLFENDLPDTYSE